MNRVMRFLIWPLSFVLLIGLYFSENIRSYYRFKEICKKDAGLRIYEPLRRSEGWQSVAANADSDAGYLLSYYAGVGYVRYRDKDGTSHDLVRTNEKKSRSDSGFRSKSIDNDRRPLYEYRDEAAEVAGEVRVNRYTSTVKNLQTSKLAVIYQDFTYRIFNPDWGLGRGTACSSLNQGDASKGPESPRELALQKAFAN